MRFKPDANAYTDTESDSYAYSDSDPYTHAYTYIDRYSHIYPFTKIQPIAKVSSDSTTSTNVTCALKGLPFSASSVIPSSSGSRRRLKRS